MCNFKNMEKYIFGRIVIFASCLLIFCYLASTLSQPAMAWVGYYFDTATNTDTCNEVQVSATETPVNTALDNEVINECTVLKPGVTNNITNYALTVKVSSYDGKTHTFAYSDDTDFCDAGYYTAGSGTGDCSCDDNPITVNQSGQTPATITMTRSALAPYTGQACGSYQMDFSILSVDGNTNCYYGVQPGGAGLSGDAETGTVCTTPPQPEPIQVNVFVDNFDNGVFTTGDSYYQGATVGVTGQSSQTTNAQGNATFNVNQGNYTVTLTVPAGFKMTTANPVAVTVGTSGLQVNFGIEPNCTTTPINCSACAAPANSCNNGNGTQTCTLSQPQACNQVVVTQSCTVNNCTNGNVCTNQTCQLPTYTVSGDVFLDANADGIQNTGEANYNGAITITGSGGTVTTNATNGTYSVSNLNAGSYTIKYTSLPNGYFMTYPTNSPPSFTITVGGSCTTNGAKNALCNAGSIQNLDFGVHPYYSISGNIFNDNNKDGLLDDGETNYDGPFSISVSPNDGSITTNIDGIYSINGLQAGTYVVSYLSLPSGYEMTYPINGPPPEHIVTVGPQCNTFSALGALCQ
jgi:hypothetical protein